MLPVFGNNGGSGNLKLVHGKLRSFTIFSFKTNLHNDKAVLLPFHRIYNSRCCIISIYLIYKRKNNNTSMNVHSALIKNVF